MAGGADASRIAMLHREPGVIEYRPQPRSRGVARETRGGEARSHMVGVRRTLVVGLVTGIAVGGNRGVVVVHVATGAGHRGMCAGQGERRVVVVKRRWNPRRCVVAQVAGLRESRRDMVRAGGFVEVGQVTGHASRAVQLVVSVDVTLRALQRSVCPSQREARAGVIEGCAVPGSGRMAGVAGGWEPRLRVVRFCGAVVVRHVTGRTHPAGQLVVAIYMTLRARHRGMRSR